MTDCAITHAKGAITRRSPGVISSASMVYPYLSLWQTNSFPVGALIVMAGRSGFTCLHSIAFHLNPSAICLFIVSINSALSIDHNAVMTAIANTMFSSMYKWWQAFYVIQPATLIKQSQLINDGCQKLVLPPGLEPGRPKSQDFKSCVSTYSTMGALAIPEGLEPSTF